MSIDTSAGVGIGYIISGSEVCDLFGKRTPEKAHFEDRFDEKTGVKKDPVKVVDQAACTTVTVDGEDFPLADGDIDGLLEALGAKFGCDVCFVCASPDSDLPEDDLLFGPRITPDDDDQQDIYDVSCDKPLRLHSVVDAWPVVVELGERLKAAGLSPGEPVAAVVGGWG